MSYTVRRFRPDEAAAFRAVRLDALTTSPEFFASVLADESERDEAYYAARLAEQPVWGVFDGEAPVGMAGLNVHEGERKRHKATLWGMYVSPAARGSGVAARLIEAVVDHARAEGLQQVLLTCMAVNTRARALYERLGFVQYGLEPRALRIGDEVFDDTLMVRRL